MAALCHGRRATSCRRLDGKTGTGGAQSPPCARTGLRGACPPPGRGATRSWTCEVWLLEAAWPWEGSQPAPAGSDTSSEGGLPDEGKGATLALGGVPIRPLHPCFLELPAVCDLRSAQCRAPRTRWGLTIVAGVAPLLGHGRARWWLLPAVCRVRCVQRPRGAPFIQLPTPCMALLGQQGGRGARLAGVVFRRRGGGANECQGLTAVGWGGWRSPCHPLSHPIPWSCEAAPPAILGTDAAPFAWCPLPWHHALFWG